MSTGLKVFNAISATILTALLWYVLYVYFFVCPIIWLGNILMFYMNFMFVIYFILIFVDKKTKIKMKKEKFVHWTIEAAEMFIMAFLFAAFGWWYYAVISIIMFMIIIVIYKKED